MASLPEKLFEKAFSLVKSVNYYFNFFIESASPANYIQVEYIVNIWKDKLRSKRCQVTQVTILLFYHLFYNFKVGSEIFVQF